MYLTLLINGEYTDELYCHKHKCWVYVDDEENCCLQECPPEEAEWLTAETMKEGIVAGSPAIPV